MNNSLILYSILGAAGEERQTAWITHIHEVMDILAVVIGVIGVAVIVWGVFCGLIQLVKLELAVFRGSNVSSLREALKEHLGFYLLLGLEFLVAADIIETLIEPSLDHLAVLGAIIAIRTVISVSLNWELSHKDGKGKPPDGDA